MCCPLKNWPPKAKFHVNNVYEPVPTLQNCDILSWGCKPPSPCPSAESVSPPNPHILLLPGASCDLPHAVPEHSWAQPLLLISHNSSAEVRWPRVFVLHFTEPSPTSCSVACNDCFSHASFLTLALGKEKDAKWLQETDWSHCTLLRVWLWHFCSQSNQHQRSLGVSIFNHPKSACFSAQAVETPSSRGCQ